MKRLIKKGLFLTACTLATSQAFAIMNPAAKYCEILGYEYVIEKDYITKLVEQTSVSFEELMTALARIIETYPTVTVKNKTRPTTPYEVVDIFTVLLQHEISFEHIYLKLISLGDDFFNQLISAKNKFSLFKKYEYDDV